MPSMTWMVNRLRLMDVAEVAWRSRKAFSARMEKARSRFAPPSVPAMHEKWGKPWIAGIDSSADFNAAVYCAAANRIMDGRFDLFALHGLALGFPPRWNQDPKTGAEAPLVFGKTLDYRDEQIVGDIKYLWEINRHYELVTLAQAWRLSGNERYSNACRVLLDSWFEACPYPLGPNWTSSLEHAVRLVNWAAAWQLLGGHGAELFAGDDGIRFRERWLRAIYRHGDFIAHHLSRYSSANNHLFGEYMGMFVASVTWPCWDESRGWLATAKRGLEEEALKQNAEDGVNLEQAAWYHHEVADMMLLCALCGRHNDIEFSRAYWKRLEAMLEYIASIMDISGNVPMIGDSDDAVMVRFSAQPDFNVYRSLLATGAVLYRRADFKKKAAGFDEKTRWLTGKPGASVYATLDMDTAKPDRRAFPNGGYHVLGSDFNTGQEVRIVTDAGALGYLSIAAHGHADALSLTLSAAGEEFLIDPGTFAYHTQPAWRAYFRGTSAHNTVRVDGLDQSEAGGNFMWLRKARARCELWSTDEETDMFAGYHDGYLRLPDPVVHKRHLLYIKRDRTLLVQDIIECIGKHDVEFWWHFAEGCDVSVHGGIVLATRGEVKLTMERQDSATAPDLHSGAESPPAGWVSRRFDQRSPSPTVVWKERVEGTTTYVTKICVHI